MALAFKKIVSLARKRTHNPLKEASLLQELLPKFSAIIPEDGGGVEKLADIFRLFSPSSSVSSSVLPPVSSPTRTKSETLGSTLFFLNLICKIWLYIKNYMDSHFRGNDKRVGNDKSADNDVRYQQPTKAYNSYVLEIGFGSGENILNLAKNNPDTGFIACEVFAGGVAKLLEDMQALEINNIRIWHDDALELIPRLPLNSLSLIYILHPDPWPKRRHHDRRLVNAENLKLLASKMLVGAKLLIITDHENYAQHIARVIPKVADLFDLEFDDYPEIVKTKYRLKAEAKGIESKYFCLVKK